MANSLQAVTDAVTDQIKILKKWQEKLVDNHNIDRVVDLILRCEGRTIISGVGKSGLIGKKIVATFASTGTPSFFLHPTEAFHGDLGMIKPSDLLILISYSGETDEVNKLIPSLKSFGNKIIGITGKADSTLAKYSDVFLDIGVEREICPNNLAPTSSTLITLALGDALAVALMKQRDFRAEDFARFHPGGSLGKKLLSKVKDYMITDNLPFVKQTASLASCLLKMTESKTGIALVGSKKDLRGIITDGDIRRALLSNNMDINVIAQKIMTESPICVDDEEYLVAAENVLKENKIRSLIVRKKGTTEIVGLFE